MLPYFLLAGLLTTVKADYASEAADSDSCAPSTPESYSLGLHVASVFVILVGSGIGVFLPVLMGPTSDGTQNVFFRRTFFVLKYFGTGIIISLAFCHLLQDSFETFSNECIGELAYEPTAPAIAMASMLVIWLVDYFGARWVSEIQHYPETVAEAPTAEVTPTSDSKPMFQDLCCESGCRPLLELDPASRRAHWDVQLLEGGIVFHSIMIGVALGAQTDGFEVTFAALVFHQLFEGLGLGARIGALVWVDTKGGVAWKKWLMCMAYTVITPIGIAIGIGVHQSFNENGRAELLAIGVLNSISAGILLYSGLCQLLYAEWVVGDMRDTSNARVASALTALGLGLFAMALIGKWT
ncbi:hypothetical protein L486_01904 [Kwoniella mangroviensis CBS 10435]|uniref:Solute carrier family 39 (Zinc transporter), member 1/2/3 n=1 Tax=Kwoniella mangroviensis CBS 10435 TaxID=1331196 RepID=A0A1B9J372_9TREE|nr:uncharacterized protein I203_06562 [Kwoniella mangroviensis CBS 8507]OCF62236.1 hypothetical protein L486_01904 [Kwoniella mangroviensis CBS 10435]OCF64381.1 hypothetical protein I203_06562 [Kwoniella mangroviensis CBS 8507]OCF73193.1 hypothetical protein I204_06423 [Kwoniella mangroviensis CBS 8886]